MTTTLKTKVFADRAAFIAYNTKQTKTWLCNAISQETGDDWSSRHDMTARELATKLADLQGWSDVPGPTILVDTQDAEVEVELTDAEMDAIEAAASDQPPADFDPILDPPVTQAEIETAKANRIAALLVELKDEKTQINRKKIRATLRKLGYRISDHREAKAEKKTVAAPTSKLKEATKKAAKKGGKK